MGWRLVTALLGAVALGVLNLTHFLGTAYGGIAERRLAVPTAPRTLAAARVAAALPPWSAQRLALYGWVLTENRVPEALDRYQAALRWAPGDALLWTEYALALGRLDRFEEDMTIAVAQAQRLAPTSAAVQQALADLGLSYWSRGAPEQRAIWLSGMRYALDHNRATFLTNAVTRGQAPTFCRDPARQLGEAAWCESMAPTLLGGCFVIEPSGPAPCTRKP